MKRLSLSILLLVLSISISCKKEEITSTTNNNGGGQNEDTNFPINGTILPLGDSRVEGARPDYESYRYELWKNLVDKGWSFDFIGSKTDDGNYTSYNSLSFDVDHEGTGGATTEDNLNTVTSLVNSNNAPNVVLLGTGGNDLLNNQSIDDAISNINQIIDHIQGVNGNVTVFLEKIAPGRSDIMTADFVARLNEFNTKVALIPAQQTTSTSSVVLVDMNSNWSDSYMADDVHYNTQGAKIVADRYSSAIELFFQ